jgi:hypothetical protein
MSEEYEQKARDLLELYREDPDKAVSYVKSVVNTLYTGMTSMREDSVPLLETIDKVRQEGVGALTKARLAKDADRLQKELMEKHAPFFQMIKERKPDIVAAIMFTVKPEYTQEMSKIIALLMDVLTVM